MGPVPDFASFFRVLMIVLLICIPLAVWKMIEIVIWLATHIDISFS